MNTKLSAMLLVMVVTTFLPTQSYATSPLQDEYIQQVMQRQGMSIIAYNNIIYEFFDSESGVLTYPNEWAGAFINYNMLIIQLTDVSQSVLDKFAYISGNSHIVDFELVPFSYNTLNYYGKAFAQDIQERGGLILSHGINTRGNTYNIVLYRNHHLSNQIYNTINNSQYQLPIPLQIELVGEIAHAPFYKKECKNTYPFFSEYYSPNLTNVGTRITSNGRSFSVGVRGYYNGYPAILTAGHSFVDTISGVDVRIGGVTIGQLFAARIGSININSSDSSSSQRYGDWGLVKLNDHGQGVISNYLPNGYISSFAYTLPVGALVFGYGSSSNTAWYGSVAMVDQTINFVSGNYAHGITMVQSHDIGPFPTHGDSGGPVWFNSGDGNTFVGVLSGGDNFIRMWSFSPLIWNQPNFTIEK